jgi:hypothetical protein
MSHRRLLQDRLISLLDSANSGTWHSEDELEELLTRQGFDRDLVQEMVDEFIGAGKIDFVVDRASGAYLLGPATPAPAQHSAS